MAPQTSPLAWKIPGRRSLVCYSPWGHQESNTTERLHFTYFAHFSLYHWRRKWQPTPVFFPGESHGWRSLVGYSPWGHQESNTTERFHFLSFSIYWMFSFWLCWVFTAVLTLAFSSCGTWAWLPLGMWDLSSLPKDWTHISCIGRQILNHWTAREVPVFTEFIDIPLSAFV